MMRRTYGLSDGGKRKPRATSSSSGSRMTFVVGESSIEKKAEQLLAESRDVSRSSV